MTDAERLATLDEEFATEREAMAAKLRKMRDVINAIHKLVCTKEADCPVCQALDD